MRHPACRGFTGRDAVIKVNGCYHGAHDSMLVKAGSGVATFAQPGSPGIPEAVAALLMWWSLMIDGCA